MKKFILRCRISKSFSKENGIDKLTYHSFCAVWNAFNDNPELHIK